MVNAKKIKRKTTTIATLFFEKSIPYISNIKKAKQKRYECKRDINYKRKVTFLLLTKSCSINATLKAYKSLKYIFYVFK